MRQRSGQDLAVSGGAKEGVITGESMPEPIVIATWPFGQTAVSTAVALLRQGKPALDAAIAGAQAVEDDPKVHSVGYAGLGNTLGTVQLDACVMDGKTLACGAVA